MECFLRVLTWIKHYQDATVFDVTSPQSKKWASSVYKMLKSDVGFCPILEKTYFANAIFFPVSNSKCSWQDWNLHGYRSRIPWRISWTDVGGKHNRFTASRLLIVFGTDLDVNVSISVATRGKNSFLKYGLNLTSSSGLLCSSNHLTGIIRSVAVKGLFPVLIFFWT